MRLVEQPMPQSYHLQDNGWTPLSQNPCWHRWYSPWPMFVYSNNLRVNIICQNNVHVGQVKSFVDDLKGTGYCKHESSLCATICWGSALVLAICVETIISDTMYPWYVLSTNSPPPPSTNNTLHHTPSSLLPQLYNTHTYITHCVYPPLTHVNTTSLPWTNNVYTYPHTQTHLCVCLWGCI